MLLCVGGLFGSCGAPSSDADPPVSAPLPPAPGLPELSRDRAPSLDSDRVIMLLPPAPDGSSWSLGGRDPNTEDAQFFDLGGDSATRGQDGGITFWRHPGHALRYASGGLEGRTARFNIRAGGGSQTYTWNSGARESGFLASPRDLTNFEATAYLRVWGYTGVHVFIGWVLRGGRHSVAEGAEASCTGMMLPFGSEPPIAYRELNHPYYDQIALTPRFPFQLNEGRWLAMKVVSYRIEGGTKNLLYLDDDPFDVRGEPRNAFRLYAQWNDRDGVSSGQYRQAATWGGWVTTLRVDGWNEVELAILSVREIIPPVVSNAVVPWSR
ncbi:MAG: hypothetical protein WBV82_18600 [Myxococcaceae bacterium]